MQLGPPDLNTIPICPADDVQFQLAAMINSLDESTKINLMNFLTNQATSLSHCANVQVQQRLMVSQASNTPLGVNLPKNQILQAVIINPGSVPYTQSQLPRVKLLPQTPNAEQIQYQQLQGLYPTQRMPMTTGNCPSSMPQTAQNQLPMNAHRNIHSPTQQMPYSYPPFVSLMTSKKRMSRHRIDSARKGRLGKIK